MTQTNCLSVAYNLVWFAIRSYHETQMHLPLKKYFFLKSVIHYRLPVKVAHTMIHHFFIIYVFVFFSQNVCFFFFIFSLSYKMNILFLSFLIFSLLDMCLLFLSLSRWVLIFYLSLFFSKLVMCFLFPFHD